MISGLFQLGIVQSWVNTLGRLPAAIMLGLSLFLTLGLGILQVWLVPPELSLSVIYLLPIAIATWFVGAKPGQFLAFLSAGATYCALLLRDIPMVSAAWNTAVLWITGAIVAELLHWVKTTTEVGKQLSRIDSATGAINRRFFMELLEAEYSRSERYRFALTIVHIHLENWSDLKKQLGHQSSNELLYQFVGQLSDTLRANDVVARLGDADFVLLLPQTNDVQAQQLFTRLQPHMKAAIASDTIPLQYSIGVTTFLEMPETLEELMELTEKLSESLKSHGKNHLEYQVFP